jgi:hypothetical protein
VRNRRSGSAVTPLRQQDIDDLAVLVDRAVQVGPAAGDLQVRLVDEPPVARGVAARAGDVDKLRCEGLHPPVDRHVIHLDAALGEQLFDVG